MRFAKFPNLEIFKTLISQGRDVLTRHQEVSYQSLESKSMSKDSALVCKLVRVTNFSNWYLLVLIMAALDTSISAYQVFYLVHTFLEQTEAQEYVILYMCRLYSGAYGRCIESTIIEQGE